MLKRYFATLVTVALLLMAVPGLAQEETYTVQAGDSIAAIASVFGVTPDALMQRNQIIDPSSLRAGQTLIIPESTFMPTDHTIKPGETLNDIATRYNTTVEALQQTNRIANPNNLTVGQDIMLPEMGGPVSQVTTTDDNIIYPVAYIVDVGETLREIAADYGTTWQQLAAYNNLPNPNYIQAGMVIYIPDPGLAIGGPTTPQPPATPVYQTYTVLSGDYPQLIAQKLGVTVESLLLLNGITNTRNLQPGDVLLVPPTGGPVQQPQPQPTLPRQTFNGFYTVQPGDNLFAIATSFGVSIYDVAQANGLLNLNYVFVGQALRIPGR